MPLKAFPRFLNLFEFYPSQCFRSGHAHLCLGTRVMSSATTHQQLVFDRRVKRLQRERAALNPDVELYDYLKDEVGFRLADRIFDIKREFQYAVDLGCGRGFLSRHVLSDCVKNLTLCDMSGSMLSQAQSTPGVEVSRKEVDEELVEVSSIRTCLYNIVMVLSSQKTLWI